MDNLHCPKDNRLMEFLGYATYFDGPYSIWRCSCGTEVANKEPIEVPD